jgi:hypothetical protein
VASFPTLVVNDSDIRVEPDYLDRVTAPLADPQVGLVMPIPREAARLRRASKAWDRARLCAVDTRRA